MWGRVKRRIGQGTLAALIFAVSLSNGAVASPLYSLQTIDFPGSTRTEARGVNNLGHVVGHYESADGAVHGFLYDGAAYHSLDYPGAIQTNASGINDAGQIVGSYFFGPDASPSGGGFLFESGAFQRIDGPHGAPAGIVDINNRGQLLGLSGPQYGLAGFVLHNGAYTPVAAPGARETWVRGINDAGIVVGYGYYSPIYMPNDPIPSSGADVRAFVFDDHGFRFATSGGRQTYHEAINGLNEILGGSSDDGRFLASLNTSLRTSLNELPILEDINDLGQIVGSYGDGKRMHGYIATPVPEPASIVAALIGAVLFAAARARPDPQID